MFHYMATIKAETVFGVNVIPVRLQQYFSFVEGDETAFEFYHGRTALNIQSIHQGGRELRNSDTVAKALIPKEVLCADVVANPFKNQVTRFRNRERINPGKIMRGNRLQGFDVVR
jgi:hypothetical protein